MKNYTLVLLLILAFTNLSKAENYKVIESNLNYIKISFDFTNQFSFKDLQSAGGILTKIIGEEYSLRKSGEPWLPTVYLNAGIPFNSQPEIKILNLEQKKFENKFVIPYPDSIYQDINSLKFDEEIYSTNSFYPQSPAEISNIYTMRYVRAAGIAVYPYQFNPVSRELLFNVKMLVQINFNVNPSIGIISESIDDPLTSEYIETSLLNPNESKNFMAKIKVEIGGNNQYVNWYNSEKDYYKIYLKEKGVYRITYEYLLNAGVPVNALPLNQLELINEGERVPIDIIDLDSNNIFTPGDYFQFVGYPPKPSPYCTSNIYNLSNVYWFSFLNDSTQVTYRNKNGFPQIWNKTYQSNLATIHYEEDLIYEKLGYANDDKRDFWYWAKVSGENGNFSRSFIDIFPTFKNFIPDSNHVKIRINMHGMTITSNCATNHNAYISLTDQAIGNAVWSNQKSFTFEKILFVSEDSVRIYPEGNRLKISVNGDACPIVNSDEIRVNWYQFEYWAYNRTNENNFYFQFSTPYIGINRYWLFGWKRDNMKIYIPSKSMVITNPQILNDSYYSVFFVDTLYGKTEYFCVADDYFLIPDSIRKDQQSDLRNTANGADYIIITNPKFMSAAQTMRDFRLSNLHGYNNPRVQIVDINDIYDEFSFGLLNPNALQSFVKYAFNNWISPAPAYVLLIGDMSSDYRGKIPDSRKNYIPSIMHFAFTFGQVPSDNAIVDIVGNDLLPELAIGRFSCETIEEANILVEKTINYPNDNSKQWKEKVALFASGLDYYDQISFGFNNQSKYLEATYLIPNGFVASKVFNYPDSAFIDDWQFKGGGPKMRQIIDDGTSIVNYYGHGGGGQWDLVFTNDDIRALNNADKLPLVLSVTCYTAHFDNQNCFGEIFTKISNRGAIGFLGSTGLTYWGPGVAINRELYKYIFNNKIYNIGKAILFAKLGFNNLPDMVSQLTYFGDPALDLALPKAPDFEVKPGDISLNPSNPAKGDTVIVKVKVRNYGIMFSDSVTIELYENFIEPSSLVGIQKKEGFGQSTSIYFTWIPSQAVLYNLIVRVNEINQIDEIDHSDNIATASFSIYDFSEPSIIRPIDGFTFSPEKVEFVLADISQNISKNITYFIEIDTSTSFLSPILASDWISPFDRLVKWKPEVNLPIGEYFWRVRLSDGQNFSSWSSVRSFAVTNLTRDGYNAYGNILKSFKVNNLYYDSENKSLQLKVELLPPKPSEETFIENIIPSTSIIDSVGMTAITTDGKYIYFGNLWYYATNIDSTGKSYIYKIGTGNYGTEKGKYYGTIPNFFDRISFSIFYHSDGYLYIPTGNPHYLKRIFLIGGDTSTVYIPDGMLDAESGRVKDGSFYMASDGNFVYNLTLQDTLGNKKYVLRIFDPQNQWNLARPDIQLNSDSYLGFSGFFAADGYVFPYENLFSGYMRRIRIDDGFFEEEWLTNRPFQGYYAWCWDWINNNVYASVFQTNMIPKLAKFKGRYKTAEGSLTSSEIGPASKWEKINFEILSDGSAGSYRGSLHAFNKNTNIWETITTNLYSNYSLQSLNSNDYSSLKVEFKFNDTTFGASTPLRFKDLNVVYTSLPEIVLSKSFISFSPDPVLQGLPTIIEAKLLNVGYTKAESVLVNFVLNDSEDIMFSDTVYIDVDSLITLNHVVPTNNLIFENNFKVETTVLDKEFFSFNNLSSKDFFIARDSIKPIFSVTVDGREIVNGDIVSATPEILITLKDNSPLPLDTSLFTIIYNNVPLSFTRPDVQLSYTPYPNSEFIIKWTPKLRDGRHTLEVLAKDASGNFFDTTSSRTIFYVYNNPDLLNVYNYPNPFKNDTYFTFELRGSVVPEEFHVKIYTIAGRLIKQFSVPSSQMDIGFNRIYWDGRDEDGDEIGNGIYFYKVISRFNNETKIITQKLAKVK